MIDIKDTFGNVRFSTEINEGSKRKFLLMKEDYITLKFSLEEPVNFKLGDYVDDPRFGLFELCDLYKPTCNSSNGGYDFELRLDAYYWKWKNKKFKFTREVGGQESSWNLTAPLDVQLEVFLRNLQALNYTYRGKSYQFSIDGTVEDKAIAMNYDNVSLLDALSSMAQTWNCEWWITNSVIHFGRCEYGTPVDFELGKNVLEMTRSDSQTNFATRIYAFGSTRNIPANYRPVDESIVVNGITQKRLMLPVSTPYIDAYPNMSTEEAVEDVVVFDDVYPHRIGRVSDIITHEYVDKIEEEGKEPVFKKWNAYRFKDSGITFSKEFQLEGQDLKIIFQSGSLNGMEFTITFNPCDKEGRETLIPEKNEDGSWNPLAQVWEIVRNEDYGRPLPDDVLRPQAEHMEGNILVPADTYILSGFDTKFVSDTMIPTAENELKEKAEKYIAKTKIDPSTYVNKMMFDYMVGEEGDFKIFEVGDRVNLINEAYFETGSRQSRIVGFEYELDLPCVSPVYTVGETASYSRIGEIENKIDSLTYKGQSYTGTGGSGVYVIGTNDSTHASNRNVFSALNSLKLFLSSIDDDEAAGLITFFKGVLIGKNGSGFTSIQDSTSQLVVDRLYVKIKAIFDELEVKKQTHVGGEQILSPAGMKCIRVEERTDAYRCYFKAEEDGIEIKNQFTAGQFAMSKECNIKTGVSHHVGNRYYWRLVTEVGADYIDLSKTKCDPNVENDIPAAGDDIVALGHETDITRQGAIVLSSVNEVAPSILMYQGINDLTLVGKEVIGFDFDKATGKARMRVYGDAYIGAKDKSSYIEYIQGKGIEIKGQLAVGSKIGDGRTIESAFKSVEDGIITAQEEAEQASVMASDAANAASIAAGVASSSASVATNAKNRLDSWAADSVISPVEKQGIKDEIVRIDADKTDIANGYTKYALGAPEAYNAAHTAYRTELVTLSSTETENIPIPADFAVKQAVYYTQRTTALAAIATAAKKVADDAAKAAEAARKSAEEALNEVSGYDYLKQALKGGTVFQGGLGLTSTMLLGQTLDNRFIVKSGVNGIYDATKPGGGISSWAGGPMKDLAEDYPLPWASTPQPTNPELYAKSVTRMDGTGYDVGGNFWKSGDGKIHCDPLSFFVGEEKVGDILSLFTPVRRNNALVGALQNIPFEDGTGKGLVKFGKHTLREDSDGNVLFEKSDGTPVNLLVTGGVTMHTLGSRSAATIMDGVVVDGTTIVKQDGKLVALGGGGSVDMTTVWSALAANTSEQINASHIPSLDWVKIGSGKPTTLAGYGITDAVTLNTAQDITANKKWTNGINSLMITTTGTITIDTTTTGGWARALEFYGNSTLAGMFGAYGGGSSLNYMYVGTSYNNPWQTWSSSEVIINNLSNATLSLKVTGTNLSGTFIQIGNNGNTGAEVGWYNGYGAYLQNDKLSTFPSICLGRTDTLLGGIQFRYSTGVYNVLHEGNYTSYALPLTGGTLTGSLTINGSIFTSGGEPTFNVLTSNAVNVRGTSNDLGFRVQQNTTNKAYFGWNTSYGAYLYNYSKNSTLHITDGGVAQFNYNTLLHAGNYNSYAPSLTGGGASGTWNININGDANTLGGVNFRHILERGNTTTANTTAPAWYRVGEFLSVNSYSPQAIFMVSRTYNSPQNEGYTFSISLGYNGSYNISQLSGEYGVQYITQIRIVYTNSGTAYLDVYCNHSGYNNTLYFTGIGAIKIYDTTIVNPTVSGSTLLYNPKIGATNSHYYSAPHMYFRNYNDSNNAGWVGRGASNNNNIYLVAHAGNFINFGTNGRSIDVSIDLNGDIIANNRLAANRLASANIRIECDNTGSWNGHGSEINNFNSHLYLQHHTRNNLILCGGGGKTAIGGNIVPAYPLHVVGNIYATSDIVNAGRFYTSFLSSVADSWTNVLQTMPVFAANGDTYVAASTSQLILGWQNKITNVGYRTTYRIGSTRGSSGVGEMRLWVGNNDAQTDGRYLALGGNGTLLWTGNTQTNGIFSSVGYGYTSTFGSLSSNYCHIYTTAPLFYMDKGLSLASLDSRGNINVAGRILVGSPSTGSEKIQVAGWYGTTGAYGWYNSTYQGGIYMNETGWLKVYNGVKWYLDGVSAWGVGGHNIAVKMYNASHVGFNMANNSYTWGIYSNSNGNLYFGRRNGNVNDSSGTYYYTFGAGLLTITGNLLLTGGATMNGSDITKKNVINRILLPLDKIAAAPLIRYRWKDNRNNETHIGGSAQYTNSLLPECAYKVGDTWSMDYATTAYAFAVSTAKHFLDYINEQATKEDARDIEIRELKRRIEILERRTA